jgi:hypothetical protein
MAINTFLQTHKHLVIVLVAALSLLFIGSKWIDHEENVAKLQADAAHQALAVQESKNEELKVLVDTQAKKYEQMLAQVTAQNSTLLQALATRQVALQKQKTVNQTSTLPELAGHWQTLTNTSSSDFTVTDKISVSESVARATVNQLDERAVLLQDNADQKQMIEGKDTLLSGLTNVNSALKEQVNGLTIQLSDQKNVCEADKAVLKAEIKKAKKRTFFAYLAVAGSVVARFVKF